jgi:hypothetical protein
LGGRAVGGEPSEGGPVEGGPSKTTTTRLCWDDTAADRPCGGVHRTGGAGHTRDERRPPPGGKAGAVIRFSPGGSS